GNGGRGRGRIVADGAEVVTERAGRGGANGGPEGAAEAAATPSAPPEVAGAAVMREFVAKSPLARHLGIELAAIERDRARLRLPFAGAIVTVGDVVHGGAISALVDTAAT